MKNICAYIFEICLILTACCGFARAGEVLRGTGTAFAVSADGYLVTCAHLLKEAKRVTVTLGNREYAATVARTDEQANVALLKIDAAGLAPLPLAVLPYRNEELQHRDDGAQHRDEEIPVRIAGYPLPTILNDRCLVESGKARSFSRRSNQQLLVLNFGVGVGFDGAPVVNEAGSVIGMADSTLVRFLQYWYDGFTNPIMPAGSIKAVLTAAGVTLPAVKAPAPDLLADSTALVRVWSDEKATQRINPKDGAPMVFVPAGDFRMGGGQAQDEQPPRTVRLDGYWIYKFEVTVAQYTRFCQATGRPLPALPDWGREPDQPVIDVSWQDAADYARWAGGALPSEAQWEKAARGTQGNTFPWGNDPWHAKGATSLGARLAGTQPAGLYLADISPYGAMDMAGNVIEWCADWYDPAYYKSAPAQNPPGPPAGDARVARGACWYHHENEDCRTTTRNGLAPDIRNDFTGFRCVMVE